jgi:hypothetical protein
VSAIDLTFAPFTVRPRNVSRRCARCAWKLNPEGSCTVNEASLGAFAPADSLKLSVGEPCARPVSEVEPACGRPGVRPLMGGTLAGGVPPPVTGGGPGDGGPDDGGHPDTVNGEETAAVRSRFCDVSVLVA